MNIKLGKTLLFLKSRTNIFSPLQMDKSPKQLTLKQWSWSLHSLDQFIVLDYSITKLVNKLKSTIQSLTKTLESEQGGRLKEIRQNLKEVLSQVIELLKRLDFLCVEHNLTHIYEGQNGLFTLYRYIWCPQILKQLNEISQYFIEHKLSQKIKLYQIKYGKYKRIIDQVIYDEANYVLKEIKKGMYLLPSNWLSPLLQGKNNNNKTLSQLILNHAKQETTDQSSFRASFTNILYLGLQENIYDYLTYLKSVILNKTTGIMNGDYEIWEKLYDVCLKVYSKKPSARAQNKLQIDQLLQQHYVDLQFTNFLKKVEISQVSISSLNFYIKNCPKNERQGLQPIAMKKIILLLETQPWKYAEDIFEYVLNEASEEERVLIIDIYSKIIKASLMSKVKQRQLFEYMVGFSQLLAYLSQRQQQMKIILNVGFLKSILKAMQNYEPTNYEFIYFLINNILISGYQQCEAIENILKEDPLNYELLYKIIIKLDKQGYIVHEDCICVLQQWLSQQNYLEQQAQQAEQSEQAIFYRKGITKLFMISGQECECKLQNIFEKDQVFSSQVLSYLEQLSSIQFRERKEIQKFLNDREVYDQQYAKSYMIIKGFKERLLIENILNITIKLKDSIPFSQILTFAVQFMSFLSPYYIQETIFVNGQTYSIYDTLTNEFPIQTMKLVFKKINQFQHMRVPSKLTYKFIGEYWKEDNDKITNAICREDGLGMIEISQIQQVKRFEFYIVLMTNVFNKLNETSQKSIKELKTIYKTYSQTCIRLWNITYPSLVLNQVHNLSESQNQIKDMAVRVKDKYSEKQLKEIVKRKIPFIQENIVQKYKILTNIREFIKIGTIVNEDMYVQNRKVLLSPFTQTHQNNKSLLYNIVRVLQFIQYSCPQQLQIQSHKLNRNFTNSLSWCQSTLTLTTLFNKSLKQTAHKEMLQSSLLQSIKIQIMKILIPFMFKDIFANKEVKGQQFKKIVDINYRIFQNICQIIQGICPGQQEHLIILLQTGQQLLLSFKESQQKYKLAQFLFKAIQTLFSFVFKGIRVRSYHLYRFIKIYSKLTGFNCGFFNSIIILYMHRFIREFIPKFKVPEDVLKLCDGNVRNQTTQTTHKYTVFTKYEGDFNIGQKICLISMFVNLFSRLNYGGLIQGIQTIWAHSQYKIHYLQYLIQITPRLGRQIETIDQKLCDIMNLDCYGNLNIVLRESRTQKQVQKLVLFLKTVLESGIKEKIRQSLSIPIKLLMQQIKLNTNTVNLQQLTDTNQQDTINLIITSYNTKLQQLIDSNIHIMNLNYMMKDNDNNKIVFEMNAQILQTRTQRKYIKDIINSKHHQQQHQLKGSVDIRATQLCDQLINKFNNIYNQCKQDHKYKQNKGKLFNSLKTLSIILINNPQLIQHSHTQILSILYDSLHHNLPIFCELYMVLMKVNGGYTQQYPNNMHYQFMIRQHLQHSLQKETNQHPKYLIDALLFTLKSTQEYRFRSYRFNRICSYKYEQEINKFQKKHYEHILHNTKAILLNQNETNLKMLMLLDNILDKIISNKQLQNLKVNLNNQLLNPCVLQPISFNKQTNDHHKVNTINKESTKNNNSIKNEYNVKLAEDSYEIREVKKAHDPYKNKKILQEILNMQTFKEITQLYKLSKEEDENQLQLLEMMFDYSLKNNDSFEDSLINMYFDEKKKSQYETLFGRRSDEVEEECDGILEDYEQNDDDNDSFGSIKMVNASTDNNLPIKQPQPIHQVPSKRTLVKMYEQSVFNPQLIKGIINIIPLVSTQQLLQFIKNVDQQLMLVINRQLMERGQNNYIKSSPIKLNIHINTGPDRDQDSGQLNADVIPEINENMIVQLILTSLEQHRRNNHKILQLIMKLLCNHTNAINIVRHCLWLLNYNDEQYEQNIKSKYTQVSINGRQVKVYIMHSIINEMIKRKIGLPLILKSQYNTNNKCIQTINTQSTHESVLQIILRQNCILQIQQNRKEDNLINNMINYFEKADELANTNHQSYPYYPIHQTIQLNQNLVIRLMDRIYNKKIILSQHQSIIDYFNLLIYIDPILFEHHFRIMVSQISSDLTKIIQKEQKILEQFIVISENSTQDTFMKQENYWNYRQSRKRQKCDQDLEYIKNVIVDFSLYLMPRFKQMRLHFHVGKQARLYKQEINNSKQKLNMTNNYKLLKHIEQKQVEYEEWKKNELNSIINSQIKPIIQSHSQNLIRLLSDAQDYIHDFVHFFQPQSSERVVIYNTCAKLYQIILATDLLAAQQKSSYHSMSKLKTKQSVQSSKYMTSRRRSSLNINLSINPMLPCAQILLKKLGTSCSFLSGYLSTETPIKELHAKYCDFDNKIKILWLNKPNKEDEKYLECNRDMILESTMPLIDQQFSVKNIKIKFQGQIGLDYGGVSREWLTLIVKEIINPDLGLFQLSANKRTFQPSRNSFLIPNHLTYFKKFGMIVGKAMQQNWLLQLNLTKSFLKHLLGSTLYVEDLEDIDPDTAKSLKWMLQNDIGEDIGLNFSYKKQILGQSSEIELVPEGSSIQVTESNKKEYIKVLANFLMTNSIRQQSKAFMKGLQTIIPYSNLKLFTYKEISLYFSGMSTVNVQQMKQNAKFQNFKPQDSQIVWFWDILQEKTHEERANFLFFLTGSYKVPYGGFKEYPIGFNKMIDCQDYLPVAHTCFSILDLPNYSSKQKMKRQLNKAIKEGKGFSVS